MKKKEGQNPLGFQLRPIIIGTAVALLFSLAVTMILAALISKGTVQQESIAGWTSVMLLVSALLGGFTAGKGCGQKKAVHGALAGTAAAIVRLLVTAFQEEASLVSMETFTAVGILVAGGFLGGVLATKRKKRNRK